MSTAFFFFFPPCYQFSFIYGVLKWLKDSESQRKPIYVSKSGHPLNDFILFYLVFAHFKVFHQFFMQLMFIFYFHQIELFLHFPPETNITKYKACVSPHWHYYYPLSYPRALRTLENKRAKPKPNPSYLSLSFLYSERGRYTTFTLSSLAITLSLFLALCSPPSAWSV